MNNPAFPSTSQKRAEPENNKMFEIHDRVRIKVGTHRTVTTVFDLAGCISVVEKRFDRTWSPYKLAGISMWFNEDELEKAPVGVVGKTIPSMYDDSLKAARSTNPSIYTAPPKPPVEYVSIKDFAEKEVTA